MSNQDDGRPIIMTRQAVAFTFAFVALIVAVSAFAYAKGLKPPDIAIIGFVAFSIIILAFAAMVLWNIAMGGIVLRGLISEPPDPNNPDDRWGKASLSRFQFLVFTFVVAGLFLMLSIETGAFVEVPTNVLTLLGISGGSFIVSKAVGQQDANKQADPAVLQQRAEVARARAQARAAEAEAVAAAARRIPPTPVPPRDDT